MATGEGRATSRRNFGPQMTTWDRGTPPTRTIHFLGMVLPCSMFLHLEVSLLQHLSLYPAFQFLFPS